MGTKKHHDYYWLTQILNGRLIETACLLYDVIFETYSLTINASIKVYCRLNSIDMVQRSSFLRLKWNKKMLALIKFWKWFEIKMKLDVRDDLWVINDILSFESFGL